MPQLSTKLPIKGGLRDKNPLKVVEKSVENRKSELQSGFVNFIRGSLSIIVVSTTTGDW
jgi:hypothetical protein